MGTAAHGLLAWVQVSLSPRAEAAVRPGVPIQKRQTPRLVRGRLPRPLGQVDVSREETMSLRVAAERSGQSVTRLRRGARPANAWPSRRLHAWDSWPVAAGACEDRRALEAFLLQSTHPQVGCMTVMRAHLF